MSIAREVKAIIRQSKLEDVLRALRQVPGLPGVTVSLVRGFGKGTDSEPQEVGETGMYKLEIVVPGSMVDVILEKVTEAAWTGQPGDGKVFVYAVDQVANIRRKVRGVEAI